MNTRRLIAALCFALVCSGLVTWQLSRRVLHETSSGKNTSIARSIVVSATGVHEGDALSNAALTTVNVPASVPLAGTFQSTSELSGRVAQVSIAPGEMVLAHDLAPAGAGTGLAVAIPPGLRAVSVHALEEPGVNSDFVVPGSRVDLLVTYRSNMDEAFVTSMILQDVRVLAVGQNRDIGTAGEKLRSDGSITLLLTPGDVARLTAANSLGRLTLALRNGADRTTNAQLMRVKFDGKAEIESRQQSAKPVRKRSALDTHKTTAGFQVETLSAGKATIQTFRGDQ